MDEHAQYSGQGCQNAASHEPNREESESDVDREDVGLLDGGPLVDVGAVRRQVGAEAEQVATAAVPDEGDAVPLLGAVRGKEPAGPSSQEDGDAAALEQPRDDGAVVQGVGLCGSSP